MTNRKLNTFKFLRKQMGLKNESRIKKLLKKQEACRQELSDMNNCTPARRIRIDIELDIIHKELTNLKFY